MNTREAVHRVKQSKTNKRNSLLGASSSRSSSKSEKDTWSKIKAQAEREKAERKKKGLPEF